MNRKDPCERYCSSCAWPVECAADEACRRREAGEIRSVYPGSDRFLAGSGAAAQPHEPGSRLSSLAGSGPAAPVHEPQSCLDEDDWYDSFSPWGAFDEAMGPLRPNEQEIGPVFVIGALASTNWVHAQIIGVDLASDPDMTGYYLPPKSQNGER